MKLSMAPPLLLLAGALVAGTEGHKVPDTAGDYFNLCKDVDSAGGAESVGAAVSKSYCNGFFTGFKTGFLFEEVNAKAKLICFPEFQGNLGAPVQPTPDEIERAFLKYMRDHPTIMHERMLIALHLTLVDAYPCSAGIQK